MLKLTTGDPKIAVAMAMAKASPGRSRTAQIVSALSVNLTPTEVAAQKSGDTTNLAAYDAFLRGPMSPPAG